MEKFFTSLLVVAVLGWSATSSFAQLWPTYPTPEPFATPTPGPSETPEPVLMGFLEPDCLDFAHWKFNDFSSTLVVTDSVGRTTGTLVGEINTRRVSLENREKQGLGRFFTLDGVNDYVLLLNDLSSVWLPESFTFSTWIKTRYHGVLFGQFWPADESRLSYLFSIDSDGYFVVMVRTEDGLVSNRSNTKVNDNLWNFVTLTFSENVYNLYINNVLDSTFSGSFPEARLNRLVFFSSLVRDSRTYFGQIDSTRVHNYALTPAQVALYWNNGEGTEDCFDLEYHQQVGILFYRQNSEYLKASIMAEPAEGVLTAESAVTTGSVPVQIYQSVSAYNTLYTMIQGKATDRLPSYPPFIQEIGFAEDAGSTITTTTLALEDAVWKLQ